MPTKKKRRTVTKAISITEKLLQVRVPEKLHGMLVRQAEENAETLTALCRRLLLNAFTPMQPRPKRRKPARSDAEIRQRKAVRRAARAK